MTIKAVAEDMSARPLEEAKADMAKNGGNPHLYRYREL